MAEKKTGLLPGGKEKYQDPRASKKQSHGKDYAKQDLMGIGFLRGLWGKKGGKESPVDQKGDRTVNKKKQNTVGGETRAVGEMKRNVKGGKEKSGSRRERGPEPGKGGSSVF